MTYTNDQPISDELLVELITELNKVAEEVTPSSFSIIPIEYIKDEGFPL